MSSLPRAARLYIVIVIALASGAVLFSVAQIGSNFDLWILVAIVTAGIIVLDFPIVLFGEKIVITLSGAIYVAAVLLFPASVAILGTFIGNLFGELRPKRPLYKKLFNIALLTISYGSSAIIFGVVHDTHVDYFGSLQNILAFLLASFVSIFVNLILLYSIISIVSQMPLFYVMKDSLRQVGWYELSHPALGAIFAILWQYNPISTLLVGVPVLLVRHSSQLSVQLQHHIHDALRALMQVIDERDHHTYNHSERVSKYAQLIAEELDLSQEEVEVVESAALLHDLGKVGMVDDVLFGTKSLNPDERKHAQKHAEVGAQLLSKLPFFNKGTPLVRHHHERIDGKGYPDGLQGDQIPLGARIISVADSYQAMTETRTYRKAMTQEQAIEQLRAGSGTQFDPVVVDAFVRVLDSNKRVQNEKPN